MLAEQINKQTKPLLKIAITWFYFGFCLQHLMITTLVLTLKHPAADPPLSLVLLCSSRSSYDLLFPPSHSPTGIIALVITTLKTAGTDLFGEVTEA